MVFGGGMSGPAPQTVRDLKARGDLASTEALQTTLGDRFLLVFRNDEEGPPSKRATTMNITHNVPGDEVDLSASEEIIKGLVYPLGLVRGSQLIISVGRLQSNDVQLPDGSISAFHAVFKINLQEGLRLQDMHSTNGTWIDGVAVPPEGVGPPVVVHSGNSIRFGAVGCVFLDADGLFQILSR
jgi:hypothetical protein